MDIRMRTAPFLRQLHQPWPLVRPRVIASKYAQEYGRSASRKSSPLRNKDAIAPGREVDSGHFAHLEDAPRFAEVAAGPFARRKDLTKAQCEFFVQGMHSYCNSKAAEPHIVFHRVCLHKRSDPFPASRNRFAKVVQEKSEFVRVAGNSRQFRKRMPAAAERDRRAL